jgi:hypothetical protein
MVFTAGAHGAPLVGAVIGHTGPSSLVAFTPTVVVDPAIPGPGPAAGIPDPSAGMTSASTTPASAVFGTEPCATKEVLGGPGFLQAGSVQSCRLGGFASGALHPAPAAAIPHAHPTAHTTSRNADFGRALPMAHVSYSVLSQAGAVVFRGTIKRSGRSNPGREA